MADEVVNETNETPEEAPVEAKPAAPVVAEVNLADMPLASVEDLLSGSDLQTKEVLIPRWGKLVIRELSAQEQIQVREDSVVADKVSTLELMKRSLRLAVVKPYLTDGVIAKLIAGSGEPITALYEEVVKLNHLGPEGEAKAEAAFPG